MGVRSNNVYSPGWLPAVLASETDDHAAKYNGRKIFVHVARVGGHYWYGNN